MEKKRPSGTKSKVMVENKLWIPPLSPQDQEKLKSLQKKNFVEKTGFVGKKLWDWLPLLIQLLGVLAIPITIAIGTTWFSYEQNQINLQIANDQRQEDILQTYLDNMSDLLLNHNLRKSKPGDEVSLIARERTLTTLRRLQAKNNRIVLQFLQDAQLIDTDNTVIDLSHTDLVGDDLSYGNLSNARLIHVNMSNTNLSGAYLNGADLSGAHLSNSLLNHGHLNDTNLSGGAYLNKSDLSGADLSGANLSGADLSGANLNGATVTLAQLAEAKSLEGTIMPDGSKHP